VEIIASPRAGAMQVLREMDEVEDVTVFGATLHARVEHGDDPCARIQHRLAAADVEVRSIEAVPTGLEDAFLYLTRKRPLLEEAS